MLFSNQAKNKAKKMVTALALAALPMLGWAEDITGIWRTVDDRTGFSKALVHIYRDKNGTYTGQIVKIIPRPNYIPKEFCQHCPEPWTNQRILGMKPLWGMQDTSTGNLYAGGRILDPLSGNIYNSKAKLSADGRRLSMRGYIGLSLLGRTQVWIRESNKELLDAIPPEMKAQIAAHDNIAPSKP